MGISSFRDLRVWQLGMNLAEEVYSLTHTFPQRETYGLASQLQRAAVSVPSNIAEGHTRESSREYLHHLSVARASLAELETQLELACRLKYISPEQLNHALDRVGNLGRQLPSLRNALERRTNGSARSLAPSP
jgi:four helix bundle protein